MSQSKGKSKSEDALIYVLSGKDESWSEQRPASCWMN